MSKFKITVKTNQRTSQYLTKSIVYQNRFEKNFKDEVEFNNNYIYATGNRTKQISKKGILETPKSTYYLLINKALLFTYFNSKENFIVESITIEIDDEITEKYTKNEILQVFSKESLTSINCSNLFSVNKEQSDLLMSCLMNLTLSSYYENSSFDYAWKAFNRLYRAIFVTNSEFDSLKELRSDIERNSLKYHNVISYFSNYNTNDLRNFNFRKMVFDDYKEANDKLVHFFEDFKDFRVCTIFQDLIGIRKNELTQLNKYTLILQNYENSIDNNLIEDTDIVRLIIIKYGYYLRCKYFHGEKWPSDFLIKNKNSEELKAICPPLTLLCKDLIENKL